MTRLLIILSMILAVAAAVLGWRTHARRQALRDRGNALQNALKQAAAELAGTARPAELPEAARKLRLDHDKQLRDTRELKNQLAGLRQKLGRTRQDLAVKYRALLKQKNQVASAEAPLRGLHLILTAEKAGKLNPQALAKMARLLEQTIKAGADLELQRATAREINEKLARVGRDLATCKDDSNRLRTQLAANREQLAVHEEKIKMLEQGVASGYSVTPAPLKWSGPPLVGKVIRVNEDYGYVVINLGSKDKLQYGLTFIVSRGRERLGQVMVSRIYKKYAIADVLATTRGARIRVGDRVSLKPAKAGGRKKKAGTELEGL